MAGPTTQPLYYVIFLTTTYTSLADAQEHAPEDIAAHLARSKRMRQDSERKRAVAHVRLRGHLPDLAYAACSTAHTSPHRSAKSRRWSARETVSFRCWR